MAAGLQLWDQNGTLVLDATHRLGRIKGIKQVTGGPDSAAADLSDGTPFWSFQPDFLYKHISNETPVPIFTISAGGVSWTYSSSAGLSFAVPVTGWVIYGVY
jgi:hypothetical protein